MSLDDVSRSERRHFHLAARHQWSRWRGPLHITGLDNNEIPELARLALWQIADQIDQCDKHVDALERRILAWHKSDEASRNLATIPGIGPITASAIAATVSDPSAFKNGRQLTAWLGLVPRQNSSGGKERLSGIMKAGNTYIRRLLVIGATSVIRYARSKAPGTAEWLTSCSTANPRA